MTLLSNNTLGALFTVPEKDWTIINKRVGEAVALAPVISYIEHYIPGFPLLIAVCDVWKGQTYDAMIRQAKRIIIYAQRAAEQLERILDLIKTTEGSADSTGEHIKQQVLELMISLTAYTVEVCKSMEGIETDIRIFLSVNFEVDEQIGRYKDKLGLLWEPLGNIIPEINRAVGNTRMGWINLLNQLQPLTKPTAVSSLESFRYLDFKTALDQWQSLEQHAHVFGMIADRQKVYW